MHALLKAHGALDLLSHPHIEAATRADMEGSREDVQAQVCLAHCIAAERESPPLPVRPISSGADGHGAMLSTADSSQRC